MPLLIGPFAGVILLALACAPALGVSQAPDATPREGVVAPEPASGEPTPENSNAPAGAPAPAPSQGPIGLAIELALLAGHLVWGGLAGWWLWKHRHTLFHPHAGYTEADLPGVGWLLLAAAMMVWFAMVTGAGSAQLLFKIGPEEYETLRGMVLVNTGGYVGGLIALGFLGVMFGPLARALGRRPRLSDAGRALGAYVIAHPFIFLAGWVCAQIAQLLAGSRPIDPLAHETLRELNEQPKDLWWIAAVLIAVLIAPILEEIIYRGMIQNGLLRLTRSPGAAIGVSALVFSLMHYSSVAPYALPVLFVLGVVFGIAYNRTGSLAVSILMHATFNAINLAQVVFLPT